MQPEPPDSLPGLSAITSRPGLNRLIARLLFGLGGSICTAGALTYGFVHLEISPAMRLMLVVGCTLLALGFAGSAWLLQKAELRTVVLVVGWSGVVMTVLTAVGLGEGLHSLSLGYIAITVCLVTVTTRLRDGAVLAVCSGIAIAALMLAERGGLLPGAHAVARTPELLNLITHGLILACALAAGALISGMLDRALQATQEREQRFSSLLMIAADWYWELDAELRISRITDPLQNDSTSAAAQVIGQHPWSVANFRTSGLDLSEHRAMLEARRPFNDLQIHCTTGPVPVRHYSLSGRPRFDDLGNFVGYWGVARDITAEMQARAGEQASEHRYQQLFSLSPMPLLLQRQGIILLANEAAAQLFGFASARAMSGFDLAQLYPLGPSRQLLQSRIAELERMPIGGAVAPAEFQLLTMDRRLRTVQATGVRVTAVDGPATLSLYHDITSRVATEAALRRSELMLTHLFATSPDFITLSEMESGRYELVNGGFTRALGYTADEVVGRTVHELGIWHRPQERAKLVASLSHRGGVKAIETIFIHKSGAPVSVMISAGTFMMDGRDYLVINGRDVTESQRAQLEHQAILENATLGIALTRNRYFIQTNPAFERMFGWSPGELVGEPSHRVWAHPVFDDSQVLLAAPGQPIEIERQMMRRDGSTFWCRLMARVLDESLPGHGGTIWIAEDITERRQIDQALAHAKDVAEAANRAKSAFLANTSHEIRTPLNGLLGLANLALQPEIDEPKRMQYLMQIQDSAQSLTGIISDILDLAKIEAGKLSVEDLAFDLHAMLQTVHHAYRSLAQAHSLDLQLHIADDVPATVRGDPVRVRQILSNFITNGLKFTVRGHVRLEVTCTPSGRVLFSVSDTGLGIAKDAQQKLFQPFVQADDSTTRRYGGTGLGLSICKELAHLMGGEVGLESTLGRGSRFWAELPLPAAEARMVDASTEAQDIPWLTGLRVLLVEDNPVNMMIGTAMLERWGIEVVQAYDGAEGVEAVEEAIRIQRPFDAVLMDVQMPRMSGHAAARQLRLQHTQRALPIIALTAAALVSEREEAMASGMNDFLTKPIDPQRLRQALIRAVTA